MRSRLKMPNNSINFTPSAQDAQKDARRLLGCYCIGLVASVGAGCFGIVGRPPQQFEALF